MTQKLLQPTTQEVPSDELISLEECKGFVGGFSLPDERVLLLRNSMIGIINSLLNAYLENFE